MLSFCPNAWWGCIQTHPFEGDYKCILENLKLLHLLIHCGDGQMDLAVLESGSFSPVKILRAGGVMTVSEGTQC